MAVSEPIVHQYPDQSGPPATLGLGELQNKSPAVGVVHDLADATVMELR